jgi:hypothetical protein
MHILNRLENKVFPGLRSLFPAEDGLSPADRLSFPTVVVKRRTGRGWLKGWGKTFPVEDATQRTGNVPWRMGNAAMTLLFMSSRFSLFTRGAAGCALRRDGPTFVVPENAR